MSLGAGARRDRVEGGVIRSAPSDDPTGAQSCISMPLPPRRKPFSRRCARSRQRERPSQRRIAPASLRPRVTSSRSSSRPTLPDCRQRAQGHLRSATAHMIRANLESLTGKPWDTDDAMPWLMPYKTKPDPALAARFHTLLDLPKETFGHAFAAFYRANSTPSRVKRKRSISRSGRRPIRRICSRATTPHRAARFWPRPSPPQCIAAKPCRATFCR